MRIPTDLPDSNQRPTDDPGPHPSGTTSTDFFARVKEFLDDLGPHPSGTTSTDFFARVKEFLDDPDEISLEPERKTLSHSTVIGYELQLNNPIAIGENARRSALTDRKPLSPALIKTALDAMNIKYERDKDGDYQLYLPNDTVTVGLSLPASSEVRIGCVYNDPIPDTKWVKALLACNEFHKTSRFGHAFFVPKNQNEALFVYEIYLDFENGMVSEEHLIRKAIVRAIEHAGELFTKIAQECVS